MALRFPYRFTNSDETEEVIFPTHHLEYEEDQEVHNSYADLTGADYAYDMVGYGQAAKKNAMERIRFLVVGEVDPVQEDLDAQVEEMRVQLHAIGRGKLWQKAADGSQRWAWARVEHVVAIRLTYENINHLPVSASFQRMSEWSEEGS